MNLDTGYNSLRTVDESVEMFTTKRVWIGSIHLKPLPSQNKTSPNIKTVPFALKLRVWSYLLNPYLLNVIYVCQYGFIDFGVSIIAQLCWKKSTTECSMICSAEQACVTCSSVTFEFWEQTKP